MIKSKHQSTADLHAASELKQDNRTIETLRDTVSRLQSQRDELARSLRWFYNSSLDGVSFRDYHDARKAAGELLNRLGK